VTTPFVTYSVMVMRRRPKRRSISLTQAMAARHSRICSRTRRLKSRTPRVYFAVLEGVLVAQRRAAPIADPLYGAAGGDARFFEFNRAIPLKALTLQHNRPRMARA
jgi:hypothetical protein